MRHAILPLYAPADDVFQWLLLISIQLPLDDTLRAMLRQRTLIRGERVFLC